MKNDFTTRRQAVVALEALKGSKTAEDVAAESGVDLEQLERWKSDVIAAFRSFGADDTIFTERLPRRSRSKSRRSQPECHMGPLSSLKNLPHTLSAKRLQALSGGPPELN